MFVIIGLGNPGKEYQKTPHNLGFMALDALSKKNDFPAFRLAKKFEAEISEGEIEGQKVILAKPQTFMNNSGAAVKKIVGNWKSEIGNLLVVHDDIDLPLGELKICQNRGSAGHKGVESIIKALKAKDFTRVRIGTDTISNLKSQISNLHLKSKILKEAALSKMTKQEMAIAEIGVKKAGGAVKKIIADGPEKAMNEFN